MTGALGGQSLVSATDPDETLLMDKNQITSNNIPFYFPDLKPPVFRDQTFDIRKYGAQSIMGQSALVSDAVLNTGPINDAINACHQAGGGKVLVPFGVWLTGPVHLKSNVNLHLEEGAELRFSQKFDDYLPVVLVKRVHLCYNYSPLLYASNCQNIAVTGSGILNGQGHAWWQFRRQQSGLEELLHMGKTGVPVNERIFGTVEAGIRPPLIQFIECKNIYLQGITVKDGPSWNVNPAFCENLIIRGIKVLTSLTSPNGDGITPDSCKHVLIEDCYVEAGDDCISIKSGRDEEAWNYGRPCEGIVIRRCTTKSGYGGMVIGSDMSAGVRNVLVEDCIFDNVRRGLSFLSYPGRGGTLENIWARNIKMGEIRSDAIHIDLEYDSGYEDVFEGKLVNLPTFRNIYYENISCENAGTALFLKGISGNYLRELTFKNMELKANEGLITRDVNDINFENVRITNMK